MKIYTGGITIKLFKWVFMLFAKETTLEELKKFNSEDEELYSKDDEGNINLNIKEI